MKNVQYLYDKVAKGPIYKVCYKFAKREAIVKWNINTAGSVGRIRGGLSTLHCHAKLKTILRVFHSDKDPVTKSDVYLSLQLLHLNSRHEQLQV